MALFTRGKIRFSPNRATYMDYDWGTGVVRLVIEDQTVWTATQTLFSPVRQGIQKIASGLAKVGATAGWTVGGGAVDAALTATLPASQTGSTLVVPVTGLKVGDVITGVHAVGQIESAGNGVTLDMDLRKMTAALADVADASVATMTQLSVTAQTIMSSANTSIVANETVGADETFYVLLTGTTGISTDIALQSLVVTVTEI